MRTDDDTTKPIRVTQEEIVQAVGQLLRKRGDIPDRYVYLGFRFGIVGEPIMTMVGDEVENAGHVYVDVTPKVMENVESFAAARGSKR